jgi:hypothetical protein
MNSGVEDGISVRTLVCRIVTPFVARLIGGGLGTKFGTPEAGEVAIVILFP